MSKYYFSRAQTRAWSSEYPVGDPTGGAAYGEKNDPVTAIVGSAVVGSILSSEASSDAADTAAQASGRASDASVGEQRRQFDLSRTDQQPFLTAGTGAVNRLAAGMAPGGEFSRSFTAADFETDPGYAFRMSEGMKALDRSAASRGGLLSGATLKGAQAYGQGLASQEYQNAFNRYQTNRANQLNPLQSLAGQGQTTATALGQQGADMASNIGNAYMTSAANTGNAAMAAAGQRQSAFGGAANVLGRMYGSQNNMTDPYANAARANQQYGVENVYGFGGGGTFPTGGFNMDVD
jgi:hypothetical protein